MANRPKLLREDPKAPKPKTSKTKTPRIVVPDAGVYLRALQGMKGVEPGRFAMYTDELAYTHSIEEFLPTGSLAIDRQLDGGWPVGRISEVAAWSAVGKSTLLDQSLAEVQRLGGVAVLNDTESARDEKYTAKLGVNLDTLIVQKALTIEESMGGIDRILAVQEAQTKLLAPKGLRPPPMLIVWDSLGGTPAKEELEGDADDAHVAVAARIIKRNLRRLTQRISNVRVAVVLANHFYRPIGKGAFAQLETYGGEGVKFFATTRIQLARTGSLKIGEHVVGHTIEVKLRKSRVNVPRAPAEVALIYGAGLHNSYSLFVWGKESKRPDGKPWISQQNPWCYLFYDEADISKYEGFQHSYMGLGELFGRRPDLYEKLARAYLAEGKIDVSLTS